MNGKKFSWLPVLLISLIVQYLSMFALVYVEDKIFPQSFFFVLAVINTLMVALIGGIIANHYYIKHSLDIGGICASIYYVVNLIIAGFELFSFTTIIILLISYYVGCFGAYLYNENQIKRANKAG
jgi:4-hydroxybenzoate polyprenyltransferase